MSDLAATNCGCGEERTNRGCGCGCGCENNGFFGMNNGSCSCILWIIILLSLCGNCGDNCFRGNGCQDNSCLILILLLLCGNGCGCGF